MLLLWRITWCLEYVLRLCCLAHEVKESGPSPVCCMIPAASLDGKNPHPCVRDLYVGTRAHAHMI
eukprot:43557-Eustigmatos_ZCMA.PRE.1